jgi:NAD(P)-dependent dehydrogenase (short-subunit alcohol dehydrogenase family)
MVEIAGSRPSRAAQAGVALITGAAKRLGRATALRLAGDGYWIAVHANRSVDDARETVAAVEAIGGRAAVVTGDLVDPVAVEALVPEAARKLGPVTLLVNNASIFEDDRLGSLDVARWNRTFSINLRAPVMLAQSLALHLPAGMEGAVVNLIDQKVLKLNPQFFTYTLTKSALLSATQMMAQALAPRIRVNAVAPGPVLPNVHDGAEIFEAEAGATPLARSVSVTDIADAVAYLAGARSTTGQMITVDSGQHLAWRTPDVVGDLSPFQPRALPGDRPVGLAAE